MKVVEEIPVEELQQRYDEALLVSRKKYKTSSATKSLCLSLGLNPSKEELQTIRLFLFNAGVTLKVGDRQCVDPNTKKKKSEQQKKIRSLETDVDRIAKIKQKLAAKTKEDKEKTKVKQKNTLKNTLAIKMADKDTWESFQTRCQEKARIARTKLPKDHFDKGILKWKKGYWLKTEEERHSIKTKKEKSNNIGFWLDGIWFGSRFELNMYRFLTEIGVKFVFQGLACNLGGYTWHPDFYLPDHNIILETKGAHPKSKQYWLEKTLPKIQKSNLCATYDVRVYWERKISATTLDELLGMCESVK